jgi:hypothetical protein
MADIIAEQAAPQVYIWMGGLFDTMLAGFPLYFWMMFIGFILFVIMIAWNWYGWSLCAPVAGYYDSVRKNIPLAIKITKNMRMKLVTAKYADQIFEWEDPQEIERWKLTTLTSVGQLGSVNTAMLIDFHDWVENPMINESIKIAADLWNSLHPEDEIHHYSKYMEYYDNGNIAKAVNDMNSEWAKIHPEEPKPPVDYIRIPSYFYIHLNEQETYLPKDNDAAGTGGWMMHEANDYKTPENEEKKTYGTWILGGCVIIGVLILAFSYMIGKGFMGQ